MSVVVDSSMAFAWSLADESNSFTDGVLDYVSSNGGIVPIHWPIEIANAFVMAVRRQRLSCEDRDACLNDLKQLDLTIDPLTNENIWNSSIEIAERHELSAYDAAYLELAMRKRLPLATLDKALQNAAQSVNVELFGIKR